MLKKSKKNKPENTKILFLDSNIEQKELFTELIKKTGYKTFYETNAIAIIDWVKNNGAPTAIVTEEKTIPLNAFQTYDYLKNELNINFPFLIARPKDHKPEDYIEKDNLRFIDRPYSKNSILQLENSINNHLSFIEPKAKLYSLNYLIELSDNNEEFINSSLNLFIESVTERMALIEEALSQNNFKEVSEIGHNIKPSFEMIENEKGAELCNQIAHKATKDTIPKLVEELSLLFKDVKQQIIGELS